MNASTQVAKCKHFSRRAGQIQGLSNAGRKMRG
jgi:hypothetical protein